MADYWPNIRKRQGTLHFKALAGVIPANIRINFTSRECRMIVPPDAKTARLYLHSSRQNTGILRTDRHICRGYYSGLHCEQCGRAVSCGKSLTSHVPG